MRRRSPWRPVGATLAALVVAMAWLYAFHSAAVVDAGAAWERAWLLAIHRWSTPGLVNAAFQISRLGYANLIVPVAAVVILIWLLQGQGWKAGRFLMVALALTVIDFTAKPFFGRARPALFPHGFVAGASYPSGHALFAVGFYGMIAYLALVGANAGLRWAGWILWALFAAALGFSRLVLGVHWPTDVVAGYVAGAIVLIVSVTAGGRPYRRHYG